MSTETDTRTSTPTPTSTITTTEHLTNATTIARIKCEINATIFRLVASTPPSESPTQTQISYALAITAGDWAKMASEPRN